MLHVYDTRFDVTENFEKKNGFEGKLNKALVPKSEKFSSL